MYSENSNQTMNQVVTILREIKNNQWKIVKHLSPRVIEVDYKRWLFMKGFDWQKFGVWIGGRL